MGIGGTNNKRPRQSSPPKKYTDLQLALKLNEVFGNIRILASETTIISGYHTTDDKSPMFNNIINRFKKLDIKLQELLDHPRERQSDAAYKSGLKHLELYNKNIVDLEMKIINTVSPLLHVVSPSRSRS